MFICLDQPVSKGSEVFELTFPKANEAILKSTFNNTEYQLYRTIKGVPLLSRNSNRYSAIDPNSGKVVLSDKVSRLISNAL
jgi:hypothetical protein